MRAERSTLHPSAHALGVSQLVAWGAAFYAVPPLLPRLARERNLSLGALSIAITLGLACNAAFVPLVMRWIARRGPREPLLAGSIAAMAALCLLASTSSRAGTVFGLVLLGASQAGLLYEPVFAIITLFSTNPTERVRALQIVTLWGGFAGFWAIPCATYVASSHGAGGALTTMALALLIPIGVFAHAPAERPVVTREALTEQRSSSLHLPMAFALSTLAITAVSVQGPAWLIQSHFDEATAAAAFALLAPMQVMGRLWLLKLRPARALQTVSMPFVLVAASLTSLLILPAPWCVAAFVAMFGAGSGMATTARAVLLSSSSSGQLGASGLSTGAARAIAPACAVWLHESAGHAATLLLLSALAATAAALLRRASVAGRHW